jgi:hypothetical protein
MPISRLVDILDVGGVPSDETFPKVCKGAFDGFRVTFQGSFSPSDDALQVRADFGNLSVSFDSIFNRGWSFLGRLETHLGRLHADEQPSRSHSESLDLGDPVDIVTDLQALFVDGRRGSLVSALGGGFLGEKGGHREDCVV